MEDRQSARSPHASEPKHQRLERRARSTPSLSGAPVFSRVVAGDTYQLPDAPLLSREQEQRLARDIEARELAHWKALLSYPPALPSVALAVAECLPRPCAPLQALAEPDAPKRFTLTQREALARELRELDVERTALRETDTRVTAAWQSQTRARPFLERVSRARTAQLEAKSSFVASNLRLVLRLARTYENSMLDKADLIQEGSIGLMRAVERFDHRRGLRFSTYASWWIRHYLNRALADKGRLIRVPVHSADTRRRVKQAQRKHSTRYGVAPSVAELVELTGLPVEVIEQTLQAVDIKPQSLDRPLAADTERTLHDLLGDPEQVNVERDLIQADRARSLHDCLRVLTTFESAVLRFRFGLGDQDALTLREVAEKYNLSRERIRQVQEAALAKLRQALTARKATANAVVA